MIVHLCLQTTEFEARHRLKCIGPEWAVTHCSGIIIILRVERNILPLVGISTGVPESILNIHSYYLLHGNVSVEILTCLQRLLRHLNEFCFTCFAAMGRVHIIMLSTLF